MTVDLQAVAKDASERVHKNGGCVPQLAFAPILWALQDAFGPVVGGWPDREVIAGLIVARTGAGTLGLTNDASLRADEPIADAILALFPPVVGWRPIETAPRDGTAIDLWHEETGRYADCYWGRSQHSCGEAGQYCDSEWHGEPEGWIDGTLNCPAGQGFTHWQPLPAAPLTTEGVGETAAVPASVPTSGTEQPVTHGEVGP